MEQISPPVKAGILIGIIASILFIYFIDPILSFIGRVFLGVAAFLQLKYLDRLYSEIAVRNMDYSYLLHIYICVAGIMVSLVMIIYLIFKKYNIVNKPKSSLKTQDDTFIFIIKILCFFSIATLMMLFMVDGYIRLETSSSFHQHMTILSPHMTDKENKELLAQFASMSSKKDYDGLIAKVNYIAK
jgi:hypothetical protein